MKVGVIVPLGTDIEEKLKRIKEMAEEQISAGIRIWKERPNFALYSSSNR